MLLQQGHERITAISIMMPVQDLGPGKQHLSYHLAVFAKKLFIGIHQDALTHCGCCLLAGNRLGLTLESQAFHPYRHGAAGHQDDFFALIM